MTDHFLSYLLGHTRKLQNVLSLQPTNIVKRQVIKTLNDNETMSHEQFQRVYQYIDYHYDFVVTMSKNDSYVFQVEAALFNESRDNDSFDSFLQKYLSVYESIAESDHLRQLHTACHDKPIRVPFNYARFITFPSFRCWAVFLQLHALWCHLDNAPQQLPQYSKRIRLDYKIPRVIGTRIERPVYRLNRVNFPINGYINNTLQHGVNSMSSQSESSTIRVLVFDSIEQYSTLANVWQSNLECPNARAFNGNLKIIPAMSVTWPSTTVN